MNIKTIVIEGIDQDISIRRTERGAEATIEQHTRRAGRQDIGDARRPGALPRWRLGRLEHEQASNEPVTQAIGGERLEEVLGHGRAVHAHARLIDHLVPLLVRVGLAPEDRVGAAVELHERCQHVEQVGGLLRVADGAKEAAELVDLEQDRRLCLHCGDKPRVRCQVLVPLVLDHVGGEEDVLVDLAGVVLARPGGRDADAVDVRAVAALVAHLAGREHGLEADPRRQRQDGLRARGRRQVVRDDLLDEPGYTEQVIGERAGVGRALGAGALTGNTAALGIKAREVHVARFDGARVAQPPVRAVVWLARCVADLVPKFLLRPRRLAARVVPIPQQTARRLRVEPEPVHHRRRGRVRLAVPARAGDRRWDAVEVRLGTSQDGVGSGDRSRHGVPRGRSLRRGCIAMPLRRHRLGQRRDRRAERLGIDHGGLALERVVQLPAGVHTHHCR